MDDEPFVSWLPDVSGWTVNELRGCDDPRMIEATERLVQQVVKSDPEDGCC